MSDSTALMLAHMRATGTIPRPLTPVALTALRSATERAGRRLVEMSTPEGELLALGWQDGLEPVAGGDTGVERVSPSPVLVLTFAAALRACWPDQADHPYPGVVATESDVLAAVASLGPLTSTSSEGADGAGAERHRKGALRRLRDAGYLVGDDLTVRLGPVVATWSDANVRALRGVYDQLPTATVATGPSAADEPEVAE